MSSMINRRLSSRLDTRKSGTMWVGGRVLVACFVASCSSGGESGASSNVAPRPSGNNPPTIVGSPATLVTQGRSYAFSPIASDSDGDTLTFSISNQPTWAGFDSGTGSLAGTPEAIHVGTTQGVTISVSDGNASANLAPFDLAVQQIQLGSATVTWDIPSTNADGSPLTDHAGFNAHYGKVSRTYTAVAMINDAAANSVLIDDLEAETWFFSVTALDQTKNESPYSTEVSKVVNP
jgi:hypothetical protein